MKSATFTAFGMTKRPGRSAANDPAACRALFNSTARALCLVGKTWDFHVDVALGVPREANLEAIRDSVAEAARQKGEALVRRRALLRRVQGQPGLCARLRHGGA